MKNYKTPALTLRQLRHFVAVAHSSSVTQAALELAITQPALTESIRQIEGRLDCQLFDRSSRRFLLTPTGEAILPMAERVLHVSSNTLDDMYALVGRRSRTLHVGMIPALAPRVIKALSRISEQLAEVTFEMDDLSNQALIEEILSGKLDLGVGFRDKSRTDLPHGDHLFNDDIVLVIPRQDELAALSSVSWQHLEERSIAVLQDGAVDGALEKANQQTDTHHEPKYRTRYIETLAEIIKQRYAVGIMPRLHAEFMAGDDLVARPLGSPYTSIEIVLFSLVQHPHVPIFVECRQHVIDLLKG